MTQTSPSRRPNIVPPFDGQQGVCCWCGAALTGRKTRWCGMACVHQYQIARGDQGRARDLLWKRDHGKCAICSIGPELFEDTRGHVSYRGVWKWEADHTIPICEGGALSLSNLRTLCVKCHRAETKKLAARRANRRTEVGGQP